MDEVNDDQAPDGQVQDPFAPENAHILAFITQARIYDVLLALLTEQNPTAAKALIEMHYQGMLVGPSPIFTGNFITDLGVTENT